MEIIALIIILGALFITYQCCIGIVDRFRGTDNSIFIKMENKLNDMTNLAPPEIEEVEAKEMECPHCFEKIKVDAKKCRHCHGEISC